MHARAYIVPAVFLPSRVLTGLFSTQKLFGTFCRPIASPKSHYDGGFVFWSPFFCFAAHAFLVLMFSNAITHTGARARTHNSHADTHARTSHTETRKKLHIYLLFLLLLFNGFFLRRKPGPHSMVYCCTSLYSTDRNACSVAARRKILTKTRKGCLRQGAKPIP